MKWGVRVTALALGLALSIAAAFFIGQIAATGQHQGTTGSGGTGTQTLEVEVDFPSNALTPTHAVPLTANLNNTTAKTVMFGGIHPTITTGAPGCLSSWFHVVAVGPNAAKWNGILKNETPVEAKYAPGINPVVTDAGTELMLQLEDTGSSQAPCESSSVTVAFNLNS